MGKKKTGVVVVPEHDTKTTKNIKLLKTVSPIVPQYKYDKRLEGVLSHLNVKFHMQTNTHFVSLRKGWNEWFGFTSFTQDVRLTSLIWTLNGNKAGPGTRLEHRNGDPFDYRISNLKNKGDHEYICTQCGKHYVSKALKRHDCNFCSPQCQQENSRHYYQCEGCDKKFTYRSGKDSHRFCTKQCAGRWKRRQTAERRKNIADELLTPYSVTVYNVSQKLDASLRKYLRKHLEKLQAKLERKQLVNWLKNGPCEECGKPKGRTINAQGENKYFCKSCSKKLTFWEFECERCGCDVVSYKENHKKFCKRCLRRRSKKRTTHKKRCEKRGLPHDQAVKTAEVGNRANWHCEICKQEILRVWITFGPDQIPHPLAPTIDHIVPLLLEDNKKHGHTWENTQLACFDCNSDKSDQCELWLTECDDPRRAIGLTNATIFSSISPDR